MSELEKAIRSGIGYWRELDEVERTQEQLVKDIAHCIRRATPKDASTQPVVVGYVSEAGLNALKDRGLVSIYRSKTKVCNVAVSVRAPVPENAPLDDFELAQCISKAVQAALATQATATQETT